MSGAAEGPVQAELPASWGRLERAAREAATGLAAWRRRALETEEEASRLRRALEELASHGADRPAGAPAGEVAEELRRLRAENLALRTRMAQARRRVASLLKRMAALESRE
ncbi:hypothetical protein BH23GEM7_BH23GEM7_26170 [soil metagenome]